MKNNQLINNIKSIVGSKNILINKPQTEYFRKGFRSGEGDALCVIFPTTLVHQWKVIQACIEANKIIIMQAANTGLTEGSTPSGSDYDREIVIINTTRMSTIHLINNAEQIISFPGATLHALEKLLKPVSRSPHSVIGSSCLGASIVGGVCNNSGGALVKRGPAYTELSLFAQLNKDGKLELINHLGIDNLGTSPEEILHNLDNGHFTDKDIKKTNKLASDKEYTQRIRETNSSTPSRYNADQRRLYEVSGCAGKVAVFAVRLDTHPIAKKEQVFYIGTNKPEVFTKLRRDMLANFKDLPEVAEYMHRGAFNLAEKYGKDTFIMINLLGTEHLPKLFSIKGAVTAYLNKISFLPNGIPDKSLQFASRLWPQCLPKRLIDYRDMYEHHLILKMSDDGIEEAKAYLAEAIGETKSEDSGYFECTHDEGSKALLHRFAAAGVPGRYQIMHASAVEDILPLDIALRRNDEEWVEQLPEHINSQIAETLYYGHFFCYVFHQDYMMKKGCDVKAVKEEMLVALKKKGAKYPAEHNVGHLYEAEEQLKSFYQQLDPTNTFNPGIGKQTKNKNCCH
ncbi:MAG: D-lactate dehydrogenase [Kiritimatiellia bacterium]|jgi:D-lactate dehydrogenase